MPTANKSPKTPETRTGSGSLGQISISRANPTRENTMNETDLQEATEIGWNAMDKFLAENPIHHTTVDRASLVMCLHCKHASTINSQWAWCKRDQFHALAHELRECDGFIRRF